MIIQTKKEFSLKYARIIDVCVAVYKLKRGYKLYGILEK
jgi:hypothetical protein